MKVLEGRKPGRANQWHARIPSTARTSTLLLLLLLVLNETVFMQTGLGHLPSLS